MLDFIVMQTSSEREKGRQLQITSAWLKILDFSLPIVCVYKRDAKFYGACNHKSNRVKVN